MSSSHPEGVDRFHPKREPCSACGNETSPHNKSLRTAQLNNHLFAAAEGQEREKQFERHMHG